MRFLLGLLDVGGRAQLVRELEAVAVRVEEVDRLDEVVVGHADHGNAVRLEAGLGALHFLDAVHAQRDVVHPGWRVRRGIGREVVAEIEERDIGAVAHLEKQVNVGAVLLRARHVVGLDDVHERQAEDILVEMPRLFAVAALDGPVMQALDGRHFRDVRRHSSSPRVNGRPVFNIAAPLRVFHAQFGLGIMREPQTRSGPFPQPERAACLFVDRGEA